MRGNDERSGSLFSDVDLETRVRSDHPLRSILAIDKCTLRHLGYEVSQRCRKRIEEMFGWIKSSAGLAKMKRRGRGRVDAAYILFDGNGGSEFAFGCVTGAISGAGDTKAVEFTWNGNDEMDEARGDGWAALQPDGSITGKICFHGGDEANFTARPWATSSTAC